MFDVLHLSGEDVTGLAWENRRCLLELLDLDGRRGARCRPLSRRLMVSWRRAGEHQLEGLVAKRMDSRYEPGRRSGAWVKVKTAQWREQHAPMRHEHWHPRLLYAPALVEGQVAVRVEEAGHEVVVHVAGAIDAATVGHLMSSIEPVLGSSQMVVFDLSGVDFADSTLLGVLLTARSEVEGGRVLVRNASRAARRLLTVAEMTDLLDDAVDQQNES